MALNQQRLSQRREAVGLTRKSLAQRHRDQTEVWLGRAEFEELIRPPLARTVEASRSDIKTTAVPVPTTVESRGLAGSDVRAPTLTQVPQRPSRTTVAPGSADVRERAPRRFTRFAAAGVLALVGGAASVPLLTSHSGSSATTTVENPAPVAAIPALKVGNGPHGEDSTGAPVAAPDKSADSPAPAAAAAVRTPQSVRSTSRSRPAGSLRAQPAPRAPEIPPEVYAAWSRMAALGAGDQDRSRLRPAASPHS